jgi:hypothetical protein
VAAYSIERSRMVSFSFIFANRSRVDVSALTMTPERRERHRSRHSVSSVCEEAGSRCAAAAYRIR